MEEEPLTDSQRAFVNVLRTPFLDGGMRLLMVVRAIQVVSRDEQLGFFRLFLQAHEMYDREEPVSREPFPYEEEDAMRAREEFRGYVTSRAIEFCKPLEDDVSLTEAAERMLRQFEFLRPKGELVQAWFLNDVGKSGYLPYAPASALPSPDPLSSDEVWALLEKRPQFFTLLFRIVRKYNNSPLQLASCLMQLLANESVILQEAATAWAIQVAPDMARDARRRVMVVMRAAATPGSAAETAKAELAALNADVSDKKKIN